MKRSKFTEARIAFAIKQSEIGIRVEEVCRKLGISEATFYNWKKKYGGLGVSELRKLRQLEEENAQLKKLVANLNLDKQMLQDVLKKLSVAKSNSSCRKNWALTIWSRQPCLLRDHFLHKSVHHWFSRMEKFDL